MLATTFFFWNKTVKISSHKLNDIYTYTKITLDTTQNIFNWLEIKTVLDLQTGNHK